MYLMTVYPRQTLGSRCPLLPAQWGLLGVTSRSWGLDSGPPEAQGGQGAGPPASSFLTSQAWRPRFRCERPESMGAGPGWLVRPRDSASLTPTPKCCLGPPALRTTGHRESRPCVGPQTSCACAGGRAWEQAASPPPGSPLAFPRIFVGMYLLPVKCVLAAGKEALAFHYKTLPSALQVEDG